MSNLTTSAALKAVASLDGPVNLRKYTKLKPDAAKYLCCEADLDLSGLRELTPELAQAFKNHNGKLILDGVEELKLLTAIALKENFKGELHFGGIKELNEDVAQVLSEREAGDGSWKYWPKTVFPKINRFNDTPGHLSFFKKLITDAPKHDVYISELSEQQAEIVSRLTKEINYSGIESLSPAVAKILSSSNQKIWLSGIKSVSAEAVEALSNHREELSLGNLDYVDDSLALALSKHIGPIRVGGLKTMPDTKGYIALAEKLTKDNSENLSLQVEEVGEQVAEIISKVTKPSLTSLKSLKETKGHKKLWDKMCSSARETDYLSFYGLTAIPSDFAESLSKCLGKVSLGSLTDWEDSPGLISWAKKISENNSPSSDKVYVKGEYFPNKIAQIFSTSPYIELQDISIFDSSEGNLALAKRLANEPKYLRLKKISPEAAEIFSKGSNSRYEVGDLIEIDKKVFEHLLSNKTHIYLSKIKNLPNEVAELCGGEKSLGFPLVEEINLSVANSLSKGKGSLDLSGLTQITNECLQELVKREGDLSLNGLHTLTEEQANLISTAKGNVNLEGIETIGDQTLSKLLELETSKTLNLKSLKKVSNENAMKLSKRTGAINLTSIEDLPETDGHISLAKKISSSWRVEQPHLKAIGPKVAKELASNSHLRLQGLEEITPEVARELAKTKTLNIKSIKEITVEAAKELSLLLGELELGNIDQVTDEAFYELCKGKVKLSFSATNLSTEKARAISTIPSLYIDGLEEISADAAKCFKNYKGDIYMSSLCRLTPEAAKELRKLRSKFSTNRAGEHALATGL